MTARPALQVIAPEATPEEVAAITAAISTVLEEQRAVAAGGRAVDSERLDAWVRASRLTARRTGLKRGPWRLSGRIGRRSRA